MTTITTPDEQSTGTKDKPPATPVNHHSAETYNWDTTFAMNFTTANIAITNGWNKVGDGAKDCKQVADDDPSFSVDATFGPWQLVMGGDGKNVRMECPFVSGTYHGGEHAFDLAAQKSSVIIEVGMEWVPDPGQLAFVISGNTEIDAVMADLDQHVLDAALRSAFSSRQIELAADATVKPVTPGKDWYLTSGSSTYWLFFTKDKDGNEFLTVYETTTTFAAQLKVLKESVQTGQPAVTIITVLNNPASGIAGAVLPELLSEWFNTNIGQFEHVFASVDITPQIDQADKYHWLKPAATGYAVVDEGTMDSSVFGVLTTIQGSEPQLNHQVSPNAIPTGTGTTGVNAGYLISGPDFLKHMMLEGARAIFDAAPADQFQITNDGLTVTNTEKLVWGRFKTDDKQVGSVPDQGWTGDLDNATLPTTLVTAFLQQLFIDVGSMSVTVTAKGQQWLLSQSGNKTEYILDLENGSLDVYTATIVTIESGQFKLSLVHSYLEIEFVDLFYPQSGDFDVHINYTEQVKLGLQDHSGRKIFWYDQTLRDLTVSVTKTKAAITREIVEGAITAALALVAVAGPIIEGLGAGAEIGAVTEDAGNAMVDAEEFAQVAADNPAAAAADDADAGAAAGEQAGGRLTSIKNAFGTPKWKLVAAIAGLAGAATGIDATVTAVTEAAVKKDWEKVPAFDDFATLAIAPYTFPDVTGMTLQSAWLADSLQLGFTVETTEPNGAA